MKSMTKMLGPVVCANCGTQYDITKITFCPYCASNKLVGDWGKEKATESLDALKTMVGGSHYSKYKIQPVEFCQANQLNYCESNIIKYVVRHRDKNGLEDLKKARHYIDLLIQLEYGEIE